MVDQTAADHAEAVAGYFSWAPGVHCAIAWDRPVLLSVDENKYFALPSTATDPVRRLVEQGSGAAHVLGRREFALWHRLRERGLAECRQDPVIRARTARLSGYTALDGWKRYESSVPLYNSADFLSTYGNTWIRLKISGLSSCLAHVAHIRGRSLDLSGANLEMLALEYNSVRILFTKRRGNCLIDSLAAFEYFARRGVVGEVVFGVRPAPVTAHAWLESRGHVLNDSAENVHRYSEILRA